MDRQESPDDVPRDPPTPVDLLLPGAWRTPRPDLRTARREDDGPLAPPPPVVRPPSTLPLPLGDYFDAPAAAGDVPDGGTDRGTDPGTDPATADGGADPAADDVPFWEQDVRAPVVRAPSPVLDAPAVIDLRPFDPPDVSEGSPAADVPLPGDALPDVPVPGVPVPDVPVPGVPVLDGPDLAVPAAVDAPAVVEAPAVAAAPVPVPAAAASGVPAAPPVVVDLRPYDEPAQVVVDLRPYEGAPAHGPDDVVLPSWTVAAPDAPEAHDAHDIHRPAVLPPLPEWTVEERPGRVSTKAVLGVAAGLLVVGGGSLAALLGGLPGGSSAPAGATSSSAVPVAVVSAPPPTTAAPTTSPTARTTPTAEVPATPAAVRTTSRRTTTTTSRTTRPGQVRVVASRYVGRPAAQVRTELAGLGVQVRMTWAFGTGGAPGTVVSVSPTGWVPVGSRVRLVVVPGPGPGPGPGPAAPPANG